MANYETTLKNIDNLMPLLQKDAINDNGIVHSAISMTTPIGESRKEKQECYNFIKSLTDEEIIDLETAMYIGRDLCTASCQDITPELAKDLYKSREIIIGNHTYDYCAEQINSKSSSRLIDYFNEYKKYVQQ